MSKPPTRWRAALTGTVAALALLVPAGVAQAAPGNDKIDKTVLGKGEKSFLVRLKAQADLTAALKATSKADKSAEVFKAKAASADASQADLRRLLTDRKARFTPFWVVNVVRVTGDAALATEIAKLPEVERVEADPVVTMPEPARAAEPAKAHAKVDAVEWNIDRVEAPKVWNEYGARGEGVVVGSISTGVELDHPALAAQYRGRKIDGTVDHNYHWYDATRTCAGGTPCDVDGAGTGNLGVVLGAAGTDTIGVAPKATWMAAKACGVGWHCYAGDLIAAGQWMLAPTDLSGRNPRPDLAPDVIVNTWAMRNDSDSPGAGYHRIYKEIVDAWTAAGIFPALDNGYSYSTTCGASYPRPGGNVNAYSAGAFDVDNKIYFQSALGPGENGEVKPNIAAPGVAVRTAAKGGGYGVATATHLPAAHVAGAVALLWSAVPSLHRDLPGTRATLDGGAVDVEDTTCGGSAAKNNVWGEGRLSAYASVRGASQRGVGGLRGKVAAQSGTPLGDAVVTVAAPRPRTAVTKADGTYEFPRLAAGAHQVTVKKLGYGEATASVTVAEGTPTLHDVRLAAVPVRTVSGKITADGEPQQGANVTVVGTPESVATDASGAYRIAVPDGDHRLRATVTSGCAGAATVPVAVNGDLVKDIALPRREDAFGYTCSIGSEPFVGGTNPVNDTMGAYPVSLPFTFPFYDDAYSSLRVGRQGYIVFEPYGDMMENLRVPTYLGRQGAIYPYWDDLLKNPESGIYTATLGTAPNRTFVLEWRDYSVRADPNSRLSFSALLGENGSIEFRYRGVTNAHTAGGSATIGFEDDKRGIGGGFSYSFNEPVLVDGQSLTFAPSRHGVLTGTVTNANDGQPVADATVKLGDHVLVATDANGGFIRHAPAGEHTASVVKEHYATFNRKLTVEAGKRTAFEAALPTGNVKAVNGEVELVMPAGTTRSGAFTITNSGAATEYTVVNDTSTWLSVTPASGTLAPGASVTVNVTGSSAGLRPGAFRTARLLVRSVSARKPDIEIPVTVVVPRHSVAVDAGGSREVTDAVGDRWSADRAYAAGGFGYVGAQSRTHTATAAIRGTAEQELFKTAREAMTEYRFDQVPNGVYTVELGFAETRAMRGGQRVFSVLAEGRYVVPALDLAQEVGVSAATTRRYTVKVADGQLNLRFAPRSGSPLVNAIRILERPDKTSP
ncbi:Serine protease, subtilisin family [Sinosporangium album]|uniref:alpha-amylase n=1 Tax=Sinosporangium album TaxID=504805 RepID=A0A1G8BNE8_9ACTN|nr:carboxypeptidase regulatory-like domain-containing protein [Sinosporangium album]SDH34747.1 Serine protease, subtilisin family [Sinosporangium album]